MEKQIRRRHINFAMKRKTLESMENKENILDTPGDEPNSLSYPNHWSHFNSLRMEFAHLASGLSKSSNISRTKELDNAMSSDENDEGAGKHIGDQSSNDLDIREWTSFLGIDRTTMDIEDQLVNLVDHIDSSIYKLVQKTRNEFKMKVKNKVTAGDVEKLRESALKNWRWLQNLSSAVDKHVSNAAEYHLFYQTLLEYQISIPQIGVRDRCKIMLDKYDGNYEEANLMYKIIKDHLTRFLRWWHKIELVIAESRKLKPLGLRMNKFDFKRPATMLTSYHGKVHLYPGEKVFVTKSGQTNHWIVESLNEPNCPTIPSLCFELCPPDVHAIERALLLRFDLLASWTTAIKEIGGVLMSFIATILGYWSNLDISSCIDQQQSRDTISKSLDTIEELLNAYWSNSHQFLHLQSRIRELKNELEIQEEQEEQEELLYETQINRNTIFLNISTKTLDEVNSQSSGVSLSRSETFILQKRAITVLVNKYKDLHKYWDEYRKLVENSSELALISEIRNAKENSVENSQIISDQLLSYLSTDDQQGWSKYLQLLSEKIHTSSHHSHHNNGPLINVLPRKLELISKSQIHNVKSGRDHSRVDVAVPAEREMKFFTNDRKQPKARVDISQYFTNSLLPTSENITRSSRRNSMDVETILSQSRYSTMPYSVSTLADHLHSTASSTGREDVFFPHIPSQSSPRHYNSHSSNFTTFQRHSSTFYRSLPRSRPTSLLIDDSFKSPRIKISVSDASDSVDYKSPPSNSLGEYKYNTLPSTMQSNTSMKQSFAGSVTTRSQTFNWHQMNDLDRVTKLRNPDQHVQSCYLVVNVPRIDRILYILDRKSNNQLTYDQARHQGLIDEHCLQVLDTETSIKYYFSEALSNGLVAMNQITTDTNRIVSPVRYSRSASGDFYENWFFKISGVFDEQNNEWISLKESVKREILNTKSGMLRIDNQSNYQHIMVAITSQHQWLNAKRLYHCNLRSLPPEMTVQLSML